VADEHDWRDVPKEEAKESVMQLGPGTVKGVSYDSVEIRMNLNFVLAEGLEVRVCRMCGAESVNGKEPELSCSEVQVKKVLDQ
jgi:hypothetical protein